MDVERTIEFILDVEAKHAAAIQRHDEMLRQLIEVNLSLTGHMETLVARVDSLATRTEETDQRVRELAESQAHSDQRLNILIDVIDKIIRRNGSSSE